MMIRTPFYPLCISMLLTACGGGGNSASSPVAVEPQTPDPEPAVTGLLVQAESEAQLLASVRAGFSRIIAESAESERLDESGPSDGLAPDSGRFTTTYTQEVSVDEHDMVKYDGRYLYIAPSRSQACCFLVDNTIPEGIADDALIAPGPEPGPRQIRILATDPERASASEVSVIPLSESRSVEGLYIEGDHLATISSTAWWGYYGAEFERVEHWSGHTVSLKIHDIAEAAAPELTWEMEVEGAFVDSRRIGSTLYMVIRHTPDLPELDYYPEDEAQKESNQRLLDDLTSEQLIPRVRVNTDDRPLFAAQDCYLIDAANALAPSQQGHPTLTAVIAIDIASPVIVETLCYDEAASGVYVSPTGIHLTQTDYGNGDRPQTLVHRFSLSRGLAYEGSGKVSGDLRTGGNLDFRISEYDDHLRLVSTTWTGDEDDQFEHQLHILKPSPETLELEILATLPNLSNPEPIGKPNEELYGVRFFGNRAYLVTFQRIDPLYVLDLSDPAAPQIEGELQVTGFSDFLHPVSEDLLLGLGQDEAGLVKLELFDISTPSAPSSLGAVSLIEGADWSHSAARYDRHAFTYQADVGGVDRFSVPISAGLPDPTQGYSQEERLYLFEILGKANPGRASLQEIGYISASPPRQRYFGSAINRAIFHDNAVFYVVGDSVWSALWSNPFNPRGPQ